MDFGVNNLDVPVFATSAKKIQILNDPIEFYSALLQGIKNASKRIVLST